MRLVSLACIRATCCLLLELVLEAALGYKRKRRSSASQDCQLGCCHGATYPKHFAGHFCQFANKLDLLLSAGCSHAGTNFDDRHSAADNRALEDEKVESRLCNR